MVQRTILIASIICATFFNVYYILSDDAWAQLTDAQYRTHVVTLIKQGIQQDAEGVCTLMNWAITYGQLGAEEREATIRFLKDISQARTGIDPILNATTKHAFKHFVEDCAAGEGFEP